MKEMMEKLNYKQQLTEQFIDLWRNERSLWDQDSPLYKSKNARKESYDKFKDSMGIEENEVKTKINSLRGYFIAELKKQKKTNDLSSKWLHFDSMTFIRNFITAKGVETEQNENGENETTEQQQPLITENHRILSANGNQDNNEIESNGITTCNEVKFAADILIGKKRKRNDENADKRTTKSTTNEKVTNQENFDDDGSGRTNENEVINSNKRALVLVDDVTCSNSNKGYMLVNQSNYNDELNTSSSIQNNTIPQMTSLVPRDGDELFALSLAQSLKTIPSVSTREFVKFKMQELIYKAKSGLLDLPK